MNRVDVIVPCYNYGRYLRQCAESVLSQVGVDVRLLIIDDASQDESSRIAFNLQEEDERVTFIRHETNCGHIATYNEGIKWLTGDFYLLLSADDYLLPGALSRAANVLAKDKEIGMVFGFAAEQKEDHVIYPNISFQLPQLQVFDAAAFALLSGCKNIVPTPTAVVRTSLQQNIGGYRSDLPHSGDMEMWFRISAYSKIARTNDVQAVYRIHSSNMSKEYYTASRLPDLLQRKAAIDSFCIALFNQGQPHQPHTGTLYRRLAIDAMDHSNSIFTAGLVEDSRRVTNFAMSVDKNANWSVPGVKLAIKRWLGYNQWTLIKSCMSFLTRSQRNRNNTHA